MASHGATRRRRMLSILRDLDRLSTLNELYFQKTKTGVDSFLCSTMRWTSLARWALMWNSLSFFTFVVHRGSFTNLVEATKSG